MVQYKKYGEMFGPLAKAFCPNKKTPIAYPWGVSQKKKHKKGTYAIQQRSPGTLKQGKQELHCTLSYE